MSYTYRKDRARTHRELRHNNFIQSSNQSASPTKQINNVSLVVSNKSIRQKQGNNNPNIPNSNQIPPAYFFDNKQRKKIIKNMIDSYFQAGTSINPETMIKHRDKRKQFITHNNITVSIVPRAQLSANRISDHFTNKIYNKKQQIGQNMQVKNMAKTTNARIFSNRSFIDTSKSNLPIIQQIHELDQVKRPQSQGKSRGLSPDSSPLFVRKPSSSQSNRAQKYQQIQQNKSNISYRSHNSNNSQSNLLQDSDGDLAMSLVFNKTTSAISRASTSSHRSYVSDCKYYSFKYSRENVLKVFNPSGMFLLSREVKLRKYGAKTLWQTNPFLNQLILQPHQPLSKQLYYKVSRLHGQEQVHSIFLQQAVYEQLFKNKSEWLRDIIIQLCKQLIVLESKFIVNKITINNVCRLKEKVVKVIDWSGASIREEIVNLDKISLVKITEPTLKEAYQNNQSQTNQANIIKWICQPEYLAPEIIRGLQNGKLDDKSLWDGNSSASDVWSLGCLIVQILTLIPLNTRERHCIKGRTYHRRGLLSIPHFSYSQLQRKQKLFSSQIGRIVRKQCQNFIHQVDSRIVQVMEKMLTFKKQHRIKPAEIINILSK